MGVVRCNENGFQYLKYYLVSINSIQVTSKEIPPHKGHVGHNRQQMGTKLSDRSHLHGKIIGKTFEWAGIKRKLIAIRNNYCQVIFKILENRETANASFFYRFSSAQNCDDYLLRICGAMREYKNQQFIQSIFFIP